MEREQQRMDKVITAIEAEVMAKLHRRAEDTHGFGDGERSESTTITDKMPRPLPQLPRGKNTVSIIAISVLLFVALVALLVLVLRLP